MKRRREAFVAAARCPAGMPLGEFGLWTIERVAPRNWYEQKRLMGFAEMVILSRWTDATMHRGRGEIVMEDSATELRRHWPIWREARGNVLITGLGLGCVIRGLLTTPEVRHITVVEKDGDIIRAVWPEFMAETRCMLLQRDAFDVAWPPGTRFDYAWHDIWQEGRPEALLHAELMARHLPFCAAQGAWGMPRRFRQVVGGDFVRA